MQQYPALTAAVDGVDGDPEEAGQFLTEVLRGMGDEVAVEPIEDGVVRVTQAGLRIVRELEGQDREDLLACWIELWRGAIHSHRTFMDLNCEVEPDQLIWTISRR